MARPSMPYLRLSCPVALALAALLTAVPPVHCSAATAAAEGVCERLGGGGACGKDTALLQRPVVAHRSRGPQQQLGRTAPAAPLRPPSTRLGNRREVPRSVYFLPVDRFAQTGCTKETPACDNDNDWCNGTLRGLIEHLDYIEEMGFEAIWITPVVKQHPGRTASGTGCMGYWAHDIYKIDEHFGTPQDMRDLVQELHRRNMVIIYDFVGNHMGPIHGEASIRDMVPFNESRYFNQLFIGNMSFDDYTNKSHSWPPPAQAMWSQSGAQCTQGMDCSCYKCKESLDEDLSVVGDGATESVGGCRGEMVFDPEGPCPEGALSKYCMPGDYACQGYNETITLRGWFYDLGDLNQTDPFVRQTQLDWIKWFVQEYDIDYLRLDTAPFMEFDFLSDLQESANVSIFGEVTTTNLTFHAQFQSNPPGPAGRPVLDGVLNFPLYYSALAGFCGEWWPFSQWNLTFLGARMEQQLEAPYRSVERLGNFVDNHDTPRIASVCNQDEGRIANAVAWTMLAKGMPIIYYGTEALLTSIRSSFWQYGFDTKREGFRFMKTLNQIRSTISATAPLQVHPTSDDGTLVFSRGDSVFVFLNNKANTTGHVEYCGVRLPEPETHYHWANALTKFPARFHEGCLVAANTLPLVLTQRPRLQSHDQ